MDTQTAYENWKLNPGPDTMGSVVRAIDPVLVAEVQRYDGPKDVLHAKAKRLAIDAVKSYDPSRETQLNTWVTSNLRPLSRYSQQIAVIRTPEVARRRAAEISTHVNKFMDATGREPSDKELADSTGLSVSQIKKLRHRVPAVVSESQTETKTEDGDVETVSPAVSSGMSGRTAYDIVYQGLDARQRFIADSRTGMGGKPVLSSTEIAKRLGVSPAFVSQTSAEIASRVSEVLRAR